MYSAIAMGKVNRDGSILTATPGIRVTVEDPVGDIMGSIQVGYRVHLPERLVKDSNYIIQLTPENYGEDGPDHGECSIAALGPIDKTGFNVVVWGDRRQLIDPGPPTMVPVQTRWFFVLYEIC